MKFARVELLSQDVEGLRVLAEKVNVEDSFGVRQIESLKIGIQACLWRPEVGYCLISASCSLLALRQQPERLRKSHGRNNENLLPAAVDIPAPVNTTTLSTPPDLMYSATAARDRSERVSGGTSSPIMPDCS